MILLLFLFEVGVESSNAGFPWKLSFGVVVIGLIIATILSKRKPKNAPPFIAGPIPWLGEIFSFAAHPINYSIRQWKALGEVFTIRLCGKRVTFLVGPEAHGPFFRSDDETVDQNEPYRFSVPIFGPGVVYDVPHHMRVQQLKYLRKALSLKHLKSYVPLIVKEAEQYFERWGDSGEVDLRDEFSQLIILTASRCLMGREIREQMFEKVASIYQTLDEGLLPISVFFPYLPIQAHRNRDRARLQMVELFGKVMKQRRENPDEEHNDVLHLFMNSRYKTPQGERFLTDAEVAGLMIALLFAGQHTSSITATWTGLLLLHNKEKFLEPVLAEQKSIVEKQHDGQLNFEALQNMTHLNNCVKEALRMYPPLIFVMRKLLKPMKYKQYTIPKNDYLFVSPAISMRDPDAFDEPDQYNPHRYLPSDHPLQKLETPQHTKKPFSYIGFGGGSHSCMGESFAYIQVKTIWSVLLRQFDFETIGPLPKPDYTAMVVGPESAKVRYTRKK